MKARSYSLNSLTDIEICLSKDKSTIRISEIQKDCWIEYPISRTILLATTAILEVPQRTSAPCLLVCGEGGSGKTTIVDRLKKDKHVSSQLVYLSLVENPGRLPFKERILEAVGLPYSLAKNENFFIKEVADYIHSHGIKGLVIDEFHEALLVPKNDQLKNLSLLKGLCGFSYNMSIICFGTGLARNAINHDLQWARRFHTFELRPWPMNNEFRNFVATLERRLALQKKSDLHNEDILSLIHQSCRGEMGALIRIIRSAAAYAVASGEERITKDLIERACQNPWGYKEYEHAKE